MRAARGLLGWSQQELAKRARVGIATVKRFEGAEGRVRGAVDTLWRIQQTLQAEGIRFIDADQTGGEGLRFTG